MPEDYSPERPRRETDRVGRKGEQDCGGLLNSGKKSDGKTSEAAVPYKKKSYHSIAVPIKLAKATFLISPCDGATALAMPIAPQKIVLVPQDLPPFANP